MTIAVTRNFLLWCTVINYGVLLVWFLVFVFAHDWMLRIHGRWFRLSRDQFDALHYAGMSIFKIGIILFNLVPFIVLSILACGAHVGPLQRPSLIFVTALQAANRTSTGDIRSASRPQRILVSSRLSEEVIYRDMTKKKEAEHVQESG
jgi:hypothetical protein